ncbi:MAG: hypothetical protein ABSC19_20350 [Syntrophorhabdales bacterium]|jgi:hypothetical protein
MGAIAISSIAFICMFGAALLGLFLRAVLPEHHLSADSKDVVKLGIGMIATLAALVVGLLISSAKGSFDTINSELRQAGAKITLLDRVMAKYGPETTEARALLRRTVVTGIKRVWPEDKTVSPAEPAGIEDVQDRLRELSPRNDAQRSLQSRAVQIASDLSEARWLLLEQQRDSSLPMPFLVILIFWLTVIFASFGLFSSPNATVIVILLVCALSAAGSIFLILELDRPAQGLIKVSDAPLRNALLHLGQ